jgi:uncharacterized protein YycO
MFVQIHNLRIGDKLVRGKMGVIKHYGIVGFHNGQYLVAENNTPDGVRYVTYDQFLDGHKLERIDRFKGNEYQRSQVIPFINSKLGTQYDFWFYNCDHFANEVQTRKAVSPQVQIGVGLSLLATVVWFGSRSNRD